MVTNSFDPPVYLITLADNAGTNRLNLPILQELTQALEAASSEPEARVIVLRSKGKTFCAGMDFSTVENPESGKEYMEKSVSLYSDLLFSIFTSAKPVVCILDGPVMAGGVGLVCACDIVLSSVNTFLEMGEVLFGIFPANVLPYLLSLRISVQKARYLILTSKRISAEEGNRLGLIDEVFPVDRFEKEATAVIRRLVRSSPEALKETKIFTRDMMDRSFQENRAASKTKLFEMLENPAVRKGIVDFQEGQLPEWFGRYRPGIPLIHPEDNS